MLSCLPFYHTFRLLSNQKRIPPPVSLSTAKTPLTAAIPSKNSKKTRKSRAFLSDSLLFYFNPQILLNAAYSSYASQIAFNRRLGMATFSPFVNMNASCSIFRT